MKQIDDNFTTMQISEDLKASEVDPCPDCGQFALRIVWPSPPEWISDEEAKEFQENTVPELTSRACGATFD